ncbi:11379_t:CDS:1, partial [Ambispora gerdemannii]
PNSGTIETTSSLGPPKRECGRHSGPTETSLDGFSRTGMSVTFSFWWTKRWCCFNWAEIWNLTILMDCIIMRVPATVIW